MKTADRVLGLVRLELRCAFPERVLNQCAGQGILLRDTERLDACTLRACVREKELPALQRVAENCQAELQLLDQRGGSRILRFLLRRPGLVLAALLLAAGLLWSNLHVWQIDVRGNETLSRGQILRALEDCGVREGCYWPGLSVDQIRSEMLLKLPELGWMTVNVSGSRALVWVVERVVKPEIYAEQEAADIIASRTGIVEHTLVKNGRSLVKPGSAVLEGEKLVTGAVDSLSHPTRYLRASAEIWADTWYQETALEPESYEQKTQLRRCKRRFALRFGKKRINCFAGSRKELDGYDKIVHEYKLGVEGLFSLPFSLTVEEYRLYERQSAQADRTAAQRRLRENLTAAVEGEILQSRLDSVSRDGWLYTELRAHCHENIARTAEVTPP